jgi:hypothetical protein
MIKRVRVYSFDGQELDSVSLGFVADWDIPAGEGVDNAGGFSGADDLIWQTGTGYGCQKNDERFGGMALLGIAGGDSCINTSINPFSGYTESNATYLFPTGGLVPGEIYGLMHQPGFRALSAETDQHSVLTYAVDLTIQPGDTLEFYAFIGTIRRGTSASLRNSVQHARQWLTDNIQGGCSCCQGLRGNVDGSADDAVTLGDLTVLIDHLFISFEDLGCVDEANVDGSADGAVSLGDLTVLVDHLFISFMELPPCP